MKKYFVLFLLLVLISPQFVKAESVLWSKALSEAFKVQNFSSAYKTHELTNPNLQIRYNSRVVNADTGQVLACGSKVAPGTKVRFEFLPHTYTDVAWFGTGTSYDSPYGSWNADAGRSEGSICLEKNFYMIAKHFWRKGVLYYKPGDEVNMETIYKLKNYMDFSVNPPTKTISGLSDVVGCQTLANGNVECKINEEKTLPTKFDFGETFSQMFYGFKAGIGTSNEKCYATENPLARAGTTTYTGGGRGGVAVKTTAATPIKIPIPSQSISCPIYIADSGTNTPPNAPTISVKNNTDNSCISGATISYDVTAVDRDTDPEDSQIRYLIDWDSDGSVDQTVPSTGYVSSNTTQTFSFVTRGDEEEQAFKVAAQDKGGLMSPWVSFNAPRCVNDELIIDPIQVPQAASGTPLTFAPGEVEFTLNPSVTNSVCKATWNAKNVSSCSLYKNGGLFQAVEISGQLDLTPGRYELRCQELRGGGTISVSKEQTCFLNPDFREL
ncbi:MAG: hypothetical protein WC087_01320 [Candidatus Paceibacterota bacterium]